MEPRYPPVPSPATHAQNHSSGHSSPAETDCESEYNEKDTYLRNDSARTERASKSTYGYAHDSVISPFSPKVSAPPSPSSSISSDVGQKHRFISDIQETHACQSHQSHRVSYPPHAHLDPEKASSYDAYEHHSQNRASVPDAAAVVYKSEYHEKGPEDKAWQLLVCITCMSMTSGKTNTHSSTSLDLAQFFLSQSPFGPLSRFWSRLHYTPCASAATVRRSPPS